MRKLSALLRPSLLGALYMLAVASWTARRAAADERLMGVSASDVARAITTTFADRVRSAALLVGALAVLVGLVLGATAGAIVSLGEQLAGTRPRDGLPRLVRTTFVLVALHLLALGWGIATRPQLYGEALYAHGGARRLAQILLTDVLGPRGVATLGALALVAYLLLPIRRSRRARMLARLPASVGWHATAVAVVVGLVVVALRWPQRAARTDSRPNVLVIAADSLRADRLTPRHTPRLSALARSGATFANAFTSLPRTFPAWVTRLTGRYPHHHGIRTMFPSREARATDLDALPGRLASAGYATSVASDYAGDVFPRARFGFERVDAPTFHFGEVVRQRALEAQLALWPFLGSRAGRALVPSVRGMSRVPAADDVTRRSLDAIDAAGGRPFFHVAFYSNAHFPYASPWPGYARETAASYRGRFKYEKANVLGREAPPDADDVRQIRALYDGAIEDVDEAAGVLLDGLAQRGLAGDTIVIVTSDHGETLFEGGRGHGHGDQLFGGEVLRVPLAIVDGRAPRSRTIGGFARDVDLAPTIYELTGVVPPARLDGASLVSAIERGDTGIGEVFAETGLWFTEDAVPADLRIPYPDVSRMLEVIRDAGDDVVLQERWRPLTTLAKHRAIVTATHQLVVAPTRGGLRTMLFLHRDDPSCEHDLAAAEPALAATLRTRLLEWTLADPELALEGEHLAWRGRRSDGGLGSPGVRLEVTP